MQLINTGSFFYAFGHCLMSINGSAKVAKKGENFKMLCGL